MASSSETWKSTFPASGMGAGGGVTRFVALLRMEKLSDSAFHCASWRRTCSSGALPIICRTVCGSSCTTWRGTNVAGKATATCRTHARLVAARINDAMSMITVATLGQTERPSASAEKHAPREGGPRTLIRFIVNQFRRGPPELWSEL